MVRLNTIYGITNTDMKTAAHILEQALHRTFELHDSDFVGEHYVARSEDRNEKFDVSENFNQIEEEWSFSAFKDYPLILLMTLREGTVSRIEQIQALIMNIANLKITLLEPAEFAEEDNDQNSDEKSAAITTLDLGRDAR